MKKKKNDFCYYNYIFILKEKKRFLKKISQFNISTEEKMFLLVLIVITAVKENEKPYFGQTHDMVERMQVYTFSENRTKKSKFETIYAHNSMQILTFPAFKCGKTLSLVLEGILINFVKLENTLNSKTLSISADIFHEITKNRSVAKIGFYVIISIVYTTMINNTLYHDE